MKQCKRLAALLLCMVLLATMIPSASAYTAGDNVNVYLDLTALLSLPEHHLLAFPWMATKYCSSAENGNTLTTSGEWIYCIDYYNKAQQGVVSSTATVLEDTTYWTNLSIRAQQGITYALIYGCPSYSNEFFGYAATQLIIWEYQTGARTSATQSCGMFSTTLASNSRLKANYDGILAQIALHQALPSFNRQKITLNGYGRANGVTITDANGTFRNDQWSISASAAKSGVVVEQTGNNLFVYATEALAPNKPVNIGLQRKLLVSTGNALCVMSAAQHAVLGTPPDPLAVSLSVQVNATGALKIKKTSEDGVVAGITFRVTGNNYDQTVTTDTNGELLLEKLLPGTYTVTEQDAPDRYEPQQPQTVTVTANATAEVQFSNVLKRGSLKIRKVSEDGVVAGITFHVTGTNGYDQTATTNDAGELLLEKLLPGTYTVTEQDAPDRYEPQQPQTVTVTANATAEVQFSNVLKRGSLKIRKVSEDGVVAGITFHVTGTNGYDQTATTNDAGELLLEKLLPGTYTVTEQDAPDRYAPQQPKTITVKADAVAEIKFENVIKRGTVYGKKVDPDGGKISGAVFGVFSADETEFTKETAVQIATSDEHGQFAFEDVLFGSWLIKELEPAEGFLANEKIYPVTIFENAQRLEIIAVNYRIPEIHTTATVGGEKAVGASGVITLTDTVSYKHLIPGKEYTLTGKLMDKATGKAFLLDGEEITSEVTFTPDEPDGEIEVEFTFDARSIQEKTDLVVFEGLRSDGIELAVHADIEDVGQTVTIIPPEIHTTADVDGEKAVGASGVITLTDTVSYKHLIPGKEYTLTGKLMDKATGEAFLLDGKEITSEVTFTPDEPDGVIEVEFTFDARLIQIETDLVVFEGLRSDGIELAVHADIEDVGQTVTIIPPEIHTTATIGGKKEATAAGTITIEDVVKYENLLPGKEYTVFGELMDKSTGKSFLVDGKPVTAEATFTPEKSSGEVKVEFTFDAAGISEKTDIVVFEAVYHEKVLLAVHADIEDEGQTVTITPPETPKTGDSSHILPWSILCGAAALGTLMIAIADKKRRATK